MCLPEIAEEFQSNDFPHLRGKRNRNVSISVDDGMLRQNSQKKYVLDYTRFGADYLLRRACEVMVYTAYKLFTKPQESEPLNDHLSLSQSNRSLPKITVTEENGTDVHKSEAPEIIQGDRLGLGLDVPERGILRRRRGSAQSRESSCNSRRGSLRASLHLDSDAERDIITRLSRTIPSKELRGLSKRSPSLDSGLGASCRTSLAFDDFDNVLSHSSSHSSFSENDDCFSSASSGSKAVQLQYATEEEEVIAWDDIEYLEPDQSVVWQFSDPTDSDIEYESDSDTDSQYELENTKLIDFQQVEITHAVPVIPSFEILDLTADSVTVTFSNTAIEQLKQQLLENPGLFANSAEIEEKEASDEVNVDKQFEFYDSVHLPKDPDKSTPETVPSEEYHLQYTETEFIASTGTGELGELETGYLNELDIWGELKQEILGLNLFEPATLDFHCEDFLTTSSDCNRFEKAEKDLYKAVGRFDYLNKSLRFRKSEEQIDLVDVLKPRPLFEQLESSGPEIIELPSSDSITTAVCDSSPEKSASLISLSVSSAAKLDAAGAEGEGSFRDENRADNLSEEEEGVVASGVAWGTTTHAPKKTSEVGTITDIHFEEDADEVNLISLVQEKIPKYRLRADTITDFAGYDNSDWVHTPVLSPEENLDLSPELVKETLKYFVLCSERVSQMTKAYNDIGAVTRLLEEKERDLELAARIGQGLLEKNDELVQKIELLEEHYAEATEKISQLRYEVSMKDSLLQVYDENYESDICHPPATDGKWSALDNSLQNLESLQKKVRVLERENEDLRRETDALQDGTLDLEEKEEQLVDDCVRHLDETNKRIQSLSDELATKSDVCVTQQEEITSLMGKAITAENKLKKAHSENEELQKHLSASQESQRQLTQEIAELEEKYNECVAVLRETQEELKRSRKHAKPSVIHQHYGTSSFFMPQGSLAMELEKSEQRIPDGYSSEERSRHMSGVFKTAEAVRRSKRTRPRRAASSAASSSTYLSELSEQALDTDGEDSVSVRSRAGSVPRGLSDLDTEGESGSLSRADSGMFGTPTVGNLGRPGIPGSNDLETAVHRLAMKRSNRNNLADQESLIPSNHGDGDKTPTPCNTPDSYSSGSHVTGWSAAVPAMPGPGGYRVPEKLQIVKPLEGSSTLYHWKRLAQPRIEGLFEPRPGVHNRGDTSASEMGEEIYSLSDYEEDDEMQVVGRGMAPCHGTNTITTARVTHPSDMYADNTTTTTQKHSPQASPITNMTTSTPKQPPAGTKNTSTPRPTSLPINQPHEATSTFSMNLGLATSLHERGLNPDAAKDGKRWRKRDIFHKVASWIAAPMRFSSITNATESSATLTKPTLSSAQADNTQAEANSTQSEVAISTQKSGIAPGKKGSEKEYLNLVAKVKELGLTHAKGSMPGLTLTSYDPVHIGLNNMMSIRRNRKLGLKPPACDAGSVFNLRDPSASSLQAGVLTKAVSLECLAKRPTRPNLRKISDVAHRPRLLPEYIANQDNSDVESSENEFEPNPHMSIIGSLGGQIHTGSHVSGLSYAMTPPRYHSAASVHQSRHSIYYTGSDDLMSQTTGFASNMSSMTGLNSAVTTLSPSSSTSRDHTPKTTHRFSTGASSKVGTGTIHSPAHQGSMPGASSTTSNGLNFVQASGDLEKVKAGGQTGQTGSMVGNLMRGSLPSTRSLFSSQSK